MTNYSPKKLNEETQIYTWDDGYVSFRICTCAPRCKRQDHQAMRYRDKCEHKTGVKGCKYINLEEEGLRVNISST